MNDDINEYVPSLLNPRSARKLSGDLTLTQHSVVSRCSLSLKKKAASQVKWNKNIAKNKENCPNSINNVKQKIPKCTLVTKEIPIDNNTIDTISYSAIDDLICKQSRNNRLSPLSFADVATVKKEVIEQNNITILTVSSATELGNEKAEEFNDTILYDVPINDTPIISLSFGIKNCQNIDVSTTNVHIKNFAVMHNDADITVDCEIEEASVLSSTNTYSEGNMNETSPNKSLKRSAVAVNLQIKKKKGSDGDEKNKVLILNTDAVDKVSHVIVQPPNYKLVKKHIVDKNNFAITNRRSLNDVIKRKSSESLVQKSIDCYFRNKSNVHTVVPTKTDVTVKCNGSIDNCEEVNSHEWEMNKYLGVNDTVKFDHAGRSSLHSSRKGAESPLSKKLLSSREHVIPSHLSSPTSLRRSEVKSSSVEGQRSARTPKSSTTPRKHQETIQFPLPSTRIPPGKTPSHVKKIPHYKIVAGTHFAVDAFSYGDIPNVKHYFLTHFHSDHYSGLRKSFNKMLFCSKITADLCVSRLGVNTKYIHIINVDETKQIEGVEVTALDANHCPGALMLVFTLPNGKTILHTGDFRAVPAMESYPVLWNKDVHTIYLDTTYCNPRYDFPTQEESLEMALNLLRQKKTALEKANKNFSSVLIVCGTYTIGKEKFFLAMARRIGCSVWACPEKDKVLQIVEDKSFSQAPPASCQLHVVPMRDLTVEKLRSYRESVGGAFEEVVAFKPSGWESGKNSAVHEDCVTIYGIPYSEHSSFSELVRFVKFVKPRQVVPTVDISGGVKAVQKFFPCPLIYKEESQRQNRVTDYFCLQNKQLAAVT